MFVRNYMTPQPVTVDPKDTLAAARYQLDSHGVRQLPVVHDGLLVGIVTDRDLRSATPAARIVEDVMTQNPITVDESSTADEAARVLRQSKVNALPVVDGDRLVGILSTSDVLDAFVALTGVAESSYRLVLQVPGDRTEEDELRSLLGRYCAEVLWLQRATGRHRSQVHVRLRTDHIGDLATALEAAGFNIVATIATAAGASLADVPPPAA